MCGVCMFCSVFGIVIVGYFEDEVIIEVMFNLDGWLWIDRLLSGLIDIGKIFFVVDGECIVCLVVYYVGVEVYVGVLWVLVELFGIGECFEGFLFLVVVVLVFVICKLVVVVFIFDDYVVKEIMILE